MPTIDTNVLLKNLKIQQLFNKFLLVLNKCKKRVKKNPVNLKPFQFPVEVAET